MPDQFMLLVGNGRRSNWIIQQSGYYKVSLDAAFPDERNVGKTLKVLGRIRFGGIALQRGILYINLQEIRD